MADARTVFILSDLHIGGAYGDAEDVQTASDRGFRMMTHAADLAALIEQWAGLSSPVEVIINGDFVDFLAEAEGTAAAPYWLPLRADPEQAKKTLRRIVSRDQAVFRALAKLLGAGHQLTILLGNHDIELSLPRVREELARLLGALGQHRLRFIYDGEAYIVGDALIEHGNRYDRYNQVSHDHLRHLRSLQSRRQPIGWNGFDPPPGSELVARVMNPIKAEYAFVDLLKPETGSVIPILLALEPGLRDEIEVALSTMAPGYYEYGITPWNDALPLWAKDIGAANAAQRVDEALAAALPAERRADFLLRIAAPAGSGDAGGKRRAAWDKQDEDPVQPIVAGRSAAGRSVDWIKRQAAAAAVQLRRARGVHALVMGERSTDLEERLPALLDALRALERDRSFELHTETAKEYERAAEQLARDGGFRYVIFGHTHLAKEVRMAGGATYLNTGTWCDLMRVPQVVLSGSEKDALAELRRFTAKLKANDIAEWLAFDLTYVRLELESDIVRKTQLVHHKQSTPPLRPPTKA